MPPTSTPPRWLRIALGTACSVLALVVFVVAVIIIFGLLWRFIVWAF